jgi:8-oxo-dGTP pyrophosphatase MutT (NUDIX family)
MASPRYASTIVLVRPEDSGGFEVLLTQRPSEMRFLGGFYVFPGGAVHESDYAPKTLDRCRGLSGAEARKILGHRHDEEVALGHWVAGVRELFEEVGILLCITDSGEAVNLTDSMTKRRFEENRQAVVREELDFGTFLESEGLCCDLTRAVYFFHRVTPEFYPMRFDTRFYIATLPPHQTPLPCSEEVTDSLWIKPERAMARVYSEDFPLLPPTTTVLETLAQINSWDRLRGKFNLR